MKRIFQRKVKLASWRTSDAQAMHVKSEHSQHVLCSAPCSSRASATALGLALSVVASGLVLQQHDSPVAAAELPTPKSSISNSSSAQKVGQENLDSLRVMQSVSVTQAPRSAAEAVRQPSKHLVREGETLWSISHKYGVSPRTLALANRLSEDATLQIGQALTLPLESQVVAESVPRSQRVSASNYAYAPRMERNLAHLQIQRLTASAAADSTSSDSVAQGSDRPLAEVDGRETPQSNAGQAVAELRVRREQLRSTLFSIRSGESPIAAFPVSSKESRVTEKLSQVMSSEPSQFGSRTAPNSVRDSGQMPPSGTVDSRLISYRLQPGDTLAAIANRHNVSLQAIIESNAISNPNRVFAGQTIQIPDASAQAESEPSGEDVLDAPPSSLGFDSETLISALPHSRISTTDDLLFSSAPVIPLPISTVESAELESPNASASDTEENGASDSTQGSTTLSAENERYRDLNTSSASLSDITENTPDAVDGNSVEEANSGGSSGIYVENLIDDIEELASSAPSEIEQILLDQIHQVAAQDTSLRVPYWSDQNYIERQDAMNPEFSSESVQVEGLDTSDSSDSEEPQSSEQLMAAAPLGSENYRPLNQPVTGRMVSPELPPLPGFEDYIPNGEATFNGYLWPATGVLTSGYGWRWGRMHRGIDIAAPVGTPIYASAPGVIEFSGWNSGGYGNMVDIRHPDGSKTRYAHNSRNLVRVGQQVTQGQQIAEMGSTGYSTGPHVHFEIHKPDTGTVNPIAYLPER